MFDRIRLWLSLVRFSHTLFALPFAVAGWLVGSQGSFEVRTFVLVVLCMATARNAAMAFNRLIDRDIDASNPRTAKRDIPAGRISPKAATIFVIANCALFVGLAWLLNPLCFALSPVALVLVLGYSLTKRFTALCHVWLGLAIGISPLAASIAASGRFELVPALLGVVLWTWMTGFDIVYATQDEDHDKGLGLHSIPAALGRKGALRVSAALHFGTLVLVFVLGRVADWGVPWHIATAICAVVLGWMHFFRKDDDLSLQSGFFNANILLSFTILAGVAFQVLSRR
ncbi:MAG: UbiA-like polyprenyltransferase [Fibrobacterota bacterium]